ncbi:DJ-1/PfpI family protein [Streptomyces sp. NPDC005476]|uniref:DJ-1/PfpI family protein n=1 Tax=Streptomyces sp. NPDC005476 TaxID=3156882 RepID=UPI003451F9A5
MPEELTPDTVPAALAAVRELAPRASRIASVCTGAFVLAALGLLDGRRATTHWAHCARLAQEYPRVRCRAPGRGGRGPDRDRDRGQSAGARRTGCASGRGAAGRRHAVTRAAAGECAAGRTFPTVGGRAAAGHPDAAPPHGRRTDRRHCGGLACGGRAGPAGEGRGRGGGSGDPGPRGGRRVSASAHPILGIRVGFRGRPAAHPCRARCGERSGPRPRPARLASRRGRPRHRRGGGCGLGRGFRLGAGQGRLFRSGAVPGQSRRAQHQPGQARRALRRCGPGPSDLRRPRSGAPFARPRSACPPSALRPGPRTADPGLDGALQHPQRPRSRHDARRPGRTRRRRPPHDLGIAVRGHARRRHCPRSHASHDLGGRGQGRDHLPARPTRPGLEPRPADQRPGPAHRSRLREQRADAPRSLGDAARLGRTP